MKGVSKMFKYNRKLWFKAAAIRAVRSIAQTAIAAIGTSLALQNVDWRMVASTSLLAGIMSVLTSLVGLPEVKEVSDDEH